MQYRSLGQTGLKLSVIGFGASPLGNAFGPTDPADGMKAVHYAIDEGINFFDVSPYYGLTLAESRLGEALAGRRDKAILATKCGRYGVAEFDFSAKTIRSRFEESLKRLRTEYVDLLQLHDVEFGDIAQIVNETLPEMRRLQQEGKARYIGITGYSLGMLAAIAKQGKVDSILSYCRYNLMISDMDDALVPFAKEQGIGVINASALHMGILTQHGAPEWHPAPKSVQEAGKKVVALCAAESADAPGVALRFCLDHAYASSTLIGMATREQVETNLTALARENSPALLEKIRQVVEPVHNLTWASGRVENHG